MSRIISGKVSLDVQWIELSAVLNESIETLPSTAQAKGVYLQAWLDPFARPIYGDPNRLRQIFWNLLNNAIKFTPKDGKVEVLLKTPAQKSKSALILARASPPSSCLTFSTAFSKGMRRQLVSTVDWTRTGYRQAAS